MKKALFLAAAATLAASSGFAIELEAPAPVLATRMAADGSGAPAAEGHPEPLWTLAEHTLDADGNLTACQAAPPERARAMQRRFADTDMRPLPRPLAASGRQGKGASRLQRRGTPQPQDPLAGLVPADYRNPVEDARQTGHLRHEIAVQIDSIEGHHQLKQVLSFEAPHWARKMLVEYIPDEPADEQGRAGLFLRPHNPFVEGVFPERTGNLAPLEMSELEVHTFAQAAYRSEATNRNGLSHYVLVTPDMDPPAADTRWHIAIGQMRDDRALAGTVRVTFSSSTYRAPLALQLYYDAEEEERQIGLFDPTPRTPDGDNPGTTQGEAMRWILFKAAEQLLDGLDFDGFMPIRVLVTTKPIGYGSPTGSASGIHTVGIDSAVPAPGRLRARMSGHWSNTGNGGARVRQDYLIPPVVWEREAGTDACRARPSDLLSGGLCGWGGETNEAARHPGEAGVPEGWIEIARDSLITEGPAAGRYFQWDKNLHDRTEKRFNAVNLIKHELFHVIGFMASSKSQAYVATFEPPARGWTAPSSSGTGTTRGCGMRPIPASTTTARSPAPARTTPGATRPSPARGWRTPASGAPPTT